MATLATGDPAPDFDLPDSTGRRWSLEDFRSSKVIVYFYPAALTPGCTLEAIDFTSRRRDFADAGYQIVGISPDAPEKLSRFIASKDLTVTLLSDPDKTVLQEYGAYGEKKLYGKTMVGVIRSTFVLDVDAKGAATVEVAQYNVKATGHVAKLRRDLGLED